MFAEVFHINHQCLFCSNDRQSFKCHLKLINAKFKDRTYLSHL